jgi:hypothetical protein
MIRQLLLRSVAPTSACVAAFIIAAAIASAQLAPSGAATPETPAAPTAKAVEAKAVEPAAKNAIRIKAGVTAPMKDEAGVTWLADQGFADGETTDRPGIEITNTKTPSVYLTERYSMTQFTQKLPNGKYIVKLHFAETYEGIEGPGQRVFTFNVEGRDFKDFDVWVKAGGPRRAYIETVPVTIADGKLDITFTPQVENPEINALEIIPAP